MKTMEELQEKTISKKGTTESGITLIALVITIIILLILATVSIAMLTGDNGILSVAREAQSQTIQGEEKEQIGLAYNAAVTLKYAEATYDPSEGITAAELQAQLTAQNSGATAVAGSTEGTIKVTFTKTKNAYTLNFKTGTIEGPITPVTGGNNTTEENTTVGD